MRTPYVLAGLVALGLAACSSTAPTDKPHATAHLQPIGDSKVTGKAKFAQHKEGQMYISAVVHGLKPNAEHGFHIHENGSCQDSGNAAGGHFNPVQSPHGKYDQPLHHAGDLPSLKADANGVATVNVLVPGLSLQQGNTNVVNRALIVHAQPDDYTSQPSGNAGARIACGIIQLR